MLSRPMRSPNAVPAAWKLGLADADALVVRSAVQVDAKLLESCASCASSVAPGWASTTLDIEAATRSGIVAMNTPGANAVAVASLRLA